MDSRASETKASLPLRRSTRQATVKVSFEPTPRGPLKRTKRGLANQAPVAAVNGSRDKENDSEDEESHCKKRRLEKGEAEGGSGDENDMEVQQSEEEKEDHQDQEMDMESQNSPYRTHPPIICPGPTGDGNLSDLVALHKRCQSGNTVKKDADRIETKKVKASTKESAAPITSAVQRRSLANKHHEPTTSMADYKRTMEAKARSAAIFKANYTHRSVYPPSEKADLKQQHVNNNRVQKESQYKKKDKAVKETANIKRSSGYSCRGFMWHFCCLVLLVLLIPAAMLAYKKIPLLQRFTDCVRYVPSDVKSAVFANRLSLLEAQFPSQRQELWKRSKIHLERHLKTAQPTEPVSLIFTAGSKANKTLHCLARGLASSFSSALNASVLHIDGASKASQDSDEVKLDIDSQLKAAFEGNKPVAVIHHLEELPPGSTLIFYRYCDHESAAYKRVFLLFTVLLPQDEISSDKCLKDVEEMVQDYVKERLVGSGSQTSFNDMDTDKYGGLWSRISHLILPVVSEKEVEQRGC